jgi:hypothetical protein
MMTELSSGVSSLVADPKVAGDSFDVELPSNCFEIRQSGILLTLFGREEKPTAGFRP